jgi:hypothetical protein
MKQKALLAAISLIIVLALFGTKVLNIQNMEENGRDASSYSDASAIIYILAGIGMIFVAWKTYHFHLIVGIIPFGLGISLLFYGLYVCWAKGMFLVA